MNTLSIMIVDIICSDVDVDDEHILLQYIHSTAMVVCDTIMMYYMQHLNSMTHKRCQCTVIQQYLCSISTGA